MPAEDLRPEENYRILVVDDNPINVELLTEYLEPLGYAVIPAYDGPDALRKVAHEQPDLILLDVMMSGMSGYEVCARLKHAPETAFLPIVLVTALGATGDRVRGAEAGADDFLTKPVEEVELLARVKSLLRIKRLHDALSRYNAELEREVAERTQQLARALADLQRLDQFKANILANMSHELRTPLTIAKGFVELLAGEHVGPLTRVQGENLETVAGALRRLQALVEDLLELNSWDPARLTHQPLSVSDLVTQALGFAATQAKARRIALQPRVAPGLLPVLGDGAALRKALQHLLGNAIKFSPEGRVVLLAADPAEQPGWVRLSVTDQGIGIPSAEIERIFDTFYQIDASVTRAYAGTGIGLTLVKLIVAAHGANVTVQSQVGKGSVFSFMLPTATT